MLKDILGLTDEFNSDDYDSDDDNFSNNNWKRLKNLEENSYKITKRKFQKTIFKKKKL